MLHSHSLLEEIGKISRDKFDELYLNKVRALLVPYYGIMDIDKNNGMIKHFEKYNNGKIKTMNFKTILWFI